MEGGEIVCPRQIAEEKGLFSRKPAQGFICRNSGNQFNMLANARSFPGPAAQWSRYEAEREEDTHRECEIQEKGSSLFPLVPCSCGVSRDAAHFGARLRLSKGRADLPGFSSLANVRVALRHAPQMVVSLPGRVAVSMRRRVLCRTTLSIARHGARAEDHRVRLKVGVGGHAMRGRSWDERVCLQKLQAVDPFGR